MDRAPAVIVTEPHRAELRELDFPEPADDQVLIRTAYSVPSPGTEHRVRTGTQPDLTYPVIPGYAASGVVYKAGRSAGLSLGQPVVAGGIVSPGVAVAWGGHAGLILARAQDVLPIPQGVSLRHAATTKLTAIAQHGVTLANPRPHDRVAVIGLGLIGQLVARLLVNRPGVRLTAADLVPDRVQTAADSGIDAVEITPDLEPLPSNTFDFVFDATGVPAVATHAVRLIKPQAWGIAPDRPPALVVQGSYPEDFSLPYDACFSKEMRVLISRDEGPGDRQEVLRRLADRSLDVDALVAESVEPDHLTASPTSTQHLTCAVRWAGG